MYDSRYVFLSDSALSRYEHGDVCRSHRHSDFERPVERRIIADDVVFVL